MNPPTELLAVLQTIRECRTLLSEVPRMMATARYVEASLALDECRAQLAELPKVITPGLDISPALRPLLDVPPLTRPGGRPGEDLGPFGDQPLW
uniref:Uncharacterized protein n=1 Tax=uncultured prokaryote TaxID=198431 RepID=A0A0H5Q5T1_9ZZZZ|nr:hypothetical protein [uncultured prokaryote]